ncbi:hypothetical protein ACHAWF_016818 [Thalassiosira exigua]
MRMQSPASSGLLPASYSRRRRNRPNESLVEGSQNGGGSAYYHHGNDPSPAPAGYGESDRAGLSPRRTNSARRPLYTLASSFDANQSSDHSENDENDKRRSNVRMDAYEEGYEDVLDKPLKLSDFLINDRCYQRYLMEGKRASYRGIGGKNATIGSSKGFLDPSFLAKVCAGASFVGMLFLIFVAIILETQPLYIKGVSVKSTTGDDGTYRFRKETSNALKAAAAYFLTMVLSLIYLQTKDMNLELNPAIGRICHLRRLIVSSYFRYRRRHYDDIPDGNSSFGPTSGSILPMHTGGDKGRRRVKKRRHRRKDGDGGGSGSIGGVLGKIKSWGVGGGSSRTGRKKDR